ncbi:MAG: helix-turn-helix transcriptional regulator [Solirubrobacteraceae bacterium]
MDGLTNREIAQALFVTAKTVDTHLGHAYAKLDISSRRDLAAGIDAVAAPRRARRSMRNPRPRVRHRQKIRPLT